MLPDSFKNRLFVPIASEHLTLRPFCSGDIGPLTALANNLNVSQNLVRLPYPYTLSDGEFFARYASESLASWTSIHLAIVERKTNELLGGIGWEEGELGFWLGEAHWQKGYGGESMGSFVHYCFEVLGLPLLKSAALMTNVASLRIFEKLGFSVVGEEMRVSKATGEEKPVFLMELSREKYVKEYTARKLPVVWVVAGALLDGDGRLLMAERPKGKPMEGVWELPGGKIEGGESPEAALVRELDEELGIQVWEGDLKPLTFASYRYGQFHLVMPIYVCHTWQGELRGREGQRLKWVTGSDLGGLVTPPADIPLLYTLMEGLK